MKLGKLNLYHPASVVGDVAGGQWGIPPVLFMPTFRLDTAKCPYLLRMLVSASLADGGFGIREWRGEGLLDAIYLGDKRILNPGWHIRRPSARAGVQCPFLALAQNFLILPTSCERTSPWGCTVSPCG